MHDRCNCHHENSGEGKLVTGLLLGGLIGAGVAVYLSTDQGKAKLTEVKAKLQKYQGELENKFEEMKAEKIDPLLEEAKAEFENTVKRLKMGTGEAKTRKTKVHVS